MVPALDGTGRPFIFEPFSNHTPAGASHMRARALFRPGMGDETKLRADETIFRIREDGMKRTLGIRWLTKTTGPPRPMTGDSQ
jgi:hypothetical protein